MQKSLRITDIAALPALPRRPLGAYHVHWVLSAFACRGPLRAVLALVGASLGFLRDYRGMLVGPDVDPLGRGPFLALDHRAAPVEAERVWLPVDVEAEEEHGVAFQRFHCMQWNKQIYQPRHVQTSIRFSEVWSLMLLFLKTDMVYVCVLDFYSRCE